jgi:hypothetical protein
MDVAMELADLAHEVALEPGIHNQTRSIVLDLCHANSEDKLRYFLAEHQKIKAERIAEDERQYAEDAEHRRKAQNTCPDYCGPPCHGNVAT